MKHGSRKTILTLLLAGLMLLASCSSGTENAETIDSVSVSADPTADAAVETVETKPVNELAQFAPGFAEEDHGGRTFMFIYGDNDFEPNLDLCAEELNGEALNDAIFERNLAIEEKYIVDVAWERYGYDVCSNKVTQSVAADESIYDVIINNGVYSFSLAQRGNTQKMNGFPNIDYTKPYWNSNMMEGSSINHKNYFVYSDINIHALGATPCTLFNKVVAEQFQFGNLYDLVREGKWTYDTMSSLIQTVTMDLNADGKITEKDMLGFIGNTFVIDCFLSGTGYQTIAKDADDLPVLNMQTEEYYNIIEQMMALCSMDNGSYICDRYAGVDREYAPMEALEEDRALFWIANLKGVERMREMDSPFGILPIPKFNEEQESYKIHYQANIGGAMSVPITASDNDLVGKVLEEMSYLSMCSVKPAYVDVLLQGKFLRDEESLVTLEIMFDSYYSDIGFLTTNSGIPVLSNLRDYIANNRSDYVSNIASTHKAYNKILGKITENYLADADD